MIIFFNITFSRVFVDQPEDHATSCNTVKDRTRLNHKTAGNLAIFDSSIYNFMSCIVIMLLFVRY